MDYILTAEDNGFFLGVGQDEVSLDDAREYRVANMVCSHRRYSLGDEQAQNIEQYENWNEWLEVELLSIHGDNLFCLPLYLYDHSGLIMNTTGFNCRWDSGQVGWIYILKADLETFSYFENEDELETRAIEIMEEEVEIYNMYLTGEVYYFELFQKNICECCGHAELELIDGVFKILARSLEELKEILMAEYVLEKYIGLVEELKAVY